MKKQIISPDKSARKILLISIIVAFAFILTLCSKKTTSPEEQLSAPSNLEISLVENNKIQLLWQDNSTNEIKFVIDRKKGEDDWFENYDEVATDITTFNDIIPTNTDTVYSYRIRAFDGENYSAYSDTVGWFSESSAPTNLQLEQIAQDSIKLTWQDNSIGELNFRIDRKIGDADWQENYKIIEPDTTSYIDYNSSLYDTCYYRVIAFSGKSHSEYSINNIISILLAPTNLIAMVVDNNILLEWNDNTDIEEGYNIERKVSGEEYELLATVNKDVITFTDENVEHHITYYYRLYAFTQEYQSDYSNEIVASISQIELWVPEVFPTIQEAIDFANEGETVLVHPGTYVENINFNGKNISIISSDGPEFTIIDGNNNGSVVTFTNVEDTTAVLNGFTLTNGSGNYTGVYVGGGIYLSNSNPRLENLIISGNSPSGTWSWGGGIDCTHSSPILTDIIISNNTVTAGGGGISCSSNSNPYLFNVIINGNTASNGGGGIYCGLDTSPIFENVIIRDNTAINSNGGGIYCQHLHSSGPSLYNVTISGNTAYDGGGICCFQNTNMVLVNVIIFNNIASRVGGGIKCDYSSSISMQNVTISGNLPDWSGAIYCADNSNISLINSILWNSSIEGIFISSSSTFTITYSDIQDGTGQSWFGTGCIDVDPLFEDANSGSFYLQSNSPCIDAGNPDQQYNDPDGTRNDMGAYGGPCGDW